MQEKDNILADIKLFICEYPVNKRGGVKRFLIMNKNRIDELLKLYSFQETLDMINNECKVNIDYINAVRTYSKIKKSSLTINNKATVTATQTKQEVVKPATTNSIKITEQQNQKINDDGLTEEEANNPIFHIKNVKIPRSFKRKLIDLGITVDEIKELKMEYYSISEAVNKLNAFLTKRKELERRKELDKLFKRGN